MQCSGCNVYAPWASVVIGILGGGAFLAWHFFMLRMGWDDPLDAVAVHAAAGIVGITAQPIFKQGDVSRECSTKCDGQG